MNFKKLIILSLLYLLSIEQTQSDNSADDANIISPEADTPIDDEPINMGLWQLLRPWRGVAMICFWAILIGICASVIFVRYCCEENGERLKRLLKRGKYSNYNFVSVYSETEAEQFGAPYCVDTDNDCDIDHQQLAQDQFDELSIIK